MGRIKKLRAWSDRNNILVVAGEEELREASGEEGMEVYERCHCGIVMDAELELLNEESKILMLSDERVIAYDYLVRS